MFGKCRPSCLSLNVLNDVLTWKDVEQVIPTAILLYNHKGLFSLTWISNHMPSKVWDEITYPFPNFNGCTIKVGEWISNFISNFIMDVVTYLSWDYSQFILVKGALELLRTVSFIPCDTINKSVAIHNGWDAPGFGTISAL